jgi:hypothetical protein
MLRIFTNKYDEGKDVTCAEAADYGVRGMEVKCHTF